MRKFDFNIQHLKEDFDFNSIELNTSVADNAHTFAVLNSICDGFKNVLDERADINVIFDEDEDEVSVFMNKWGRKVTLYKVYVNNNNNIILSICHNEADYLGVRGHID